MVPPHGRVVVNGGDAALARVLARGCWSEVERFGLAEVPGTGPDWTVAMDGTILLGGAPQGTLAFGQPGRHNQLNALAALAAARHVGVPVAHGLAALSRVSRACGGAWRCAARCAASRSTTTSRIIRPRSPRRSRRCAAASARARILAVLEPRSNTMKLGAMKDALPGQPARRADRVFCYAAQPRLGRRRRARAAGRARPRCIADLPALVDGDRAPRRGPGDHVLVMSNGGFGGIHEKLLASRGVARER